MKVAILVGSLRKESYNMRLAKTIMESFQEKAELEIVNIHELPHFDQDAEENPPEVVTQFKNKIAAADGVIIVTPEYNWSVPGVLKNAIDWASRVDKVFIGKPVMTMGATLGMLGTVRAQLHLREILSSPGVQAKVLPPGGNEVLVGNVNQKFDEQTGAFVDETTLQFIESKVQTFIEFVKANQ